jgi:hypothetical protein
MAKVQKVFNVDDEVAAIADVLIAECKDIKAKAAVGQYMSDLSKLLPFMAEIGNLGADLKNNPDNRAYLAIALEQAVEAFLMPAPAAPAAPAAPKA